MNLEPDYRAIADAIVGNLEGRKHVIDLDLEEELVEEIMQEMADTIREMMPAAPPICPTAEWQPIETAPKDGKRFLAATLIPNHRMVITMCGVAGILLDEQCQPLPWPMTHWMPLPAAPEYEK